MGAIKEYVMENIEDLITNADKVCLQAAELADAIEELITDKYEEIRDRMLDDTGIDLDEVDLGETIDIKNYGRILDTLEDIKNLINAEL